MTKRARKAREKAMTQLEMNRKAIGRMCDSFYHSHVKNAPRWRTLKRVRTELHRKGVFFCTDRLPF